MKHFINKVFLPTIILQVLCLNLNAQPGKTYGMKYWNWMEKYHSIDEHFKDPNFKKLYFLAKEKKDKQVLKESESLLQKYPRDEDYLKYYISSLYNLGRKDTACQLAIQLIHQNFLYRQQQGVSANVLLFPFAFNPCFYKIGTDTIISNYVYEVFSNGYQQYDYPNMPLALKLIELNYQDQLIRYRLDFNSIKAQDLDEAKRVYQQFSQSAKKNNREFAALYKNHPDFITEMEVGPVAGYQHILIWHSGDSLVQNFYLPMLKKAMLEKEIPTREYIDMYTRKYSYSGNTKRLKKVTDSLCQLYGCEGEIIIYDN